jgi:protein transport protein SEC31
MLQVMAVDFAANTPRELPVKGAVKSNERFHRLAWGGLSSTPSMPYGILAGGMVDGGIGLWNPAAIMKYGFFRISKLLRF